MYNCVVFTGMVECETENSKWEIIIPIWLIINSIIYIYIYIYIYTRMCKYFFNLVIFWVGESRVGSLMRNFRYNIKDLLWDDLI